MNRAFSCKNQSKKRAFNLTEVLITLTVIGVVSALTIPAVLTSRAKQTTAVKLEKFYLAMSDATKMWSMTVNSLNYPANAVNNADKTLDFWNKNFAKYFNVISAQPYQENGEDSNGYIKIVFANGASVLARLEGINNFNFYYCTKSDCEVGHYDGKTSFLFTMYKDKFYTGFPIPQHPEQLTYNRETLLDYCRNGYDEDENKKPLCSRLIQVDGWRIANDYPW